MTETVVIGGGFAGVAAACRLAGDGHRPILLERATSLGGRARSARLTTPPVTIDTGHHVLMRCCTASTGFLARIGASDAIRFQPALSIPIVSPTDRGRLASSPLPGLFHLAPALLRYPILQLPDRLRAISAGLAIALGGAKEDIPFDRWLRRHRQSDRAIDALWDPICIATLNAHADSSGAPAARKVLRDAFFRPGGADMGLFTAPLSCIFDAARRNLEARGAIVRTRAGARRLLIEDGRVRGIELDDGETIDADTIVCAVTPSELARLTANVPELESTIDAATRLRWAPIVNVHAWFDRPILDGAFAIAVDSPLQAVFDLTRIYGPAAGDDPTHLVLSQSAAEDWIERPFADVSGPLVQALRELFPRAAHARCLRTLVFRHRAATFVPEPGVGRCRPRSTTSIDGLLLAGDWTATGWPSTIEGAVRSGIVAAAHAESGLTSPTPA